MIRADPPTFAIVSGLAAVLVFVFLFLGMYWHSAVFVLIAFGARKTHLEQTRPKKVEDRKEAPPPTDTA